MMKALTTKALRSGALASVFLSTLACPGRPVDETPPPDPICATCDTTHPLNALLAPDFARAGIEPRIAPPHELCGRLGFDLVGRPLSAVERSSCESRVQNGEVDAAVLALQGTSDYLVTAQRRWADRIATTDVVVDWRATVSLYDMIDAVQRGELAYDAFVVELLAHPGLMAADFTPQERVARVFVTLFDRTPTEAETTAIGPLWNAWLADFGARDPELPLPRNRAYVLPALCASSGGCSTTLWGGARVDFPATLPGSEFDPIYLDDIPDDVNEALRTPGRLFAEQLETYESMADILLNRFLDWDEGERDIRTPGHLFPAVRNHLADVLMETGDLPTIERLILTSVLYTQTAIALDGDGTALDGTGDVLHPLSVGPTKAINAEAWLFSMQNVTSFDIGTCDPRFTDGFQYGLLYQAYLDGELTGAGYNAAVQRLFELRRDIGSLQDAEEQAADGTDLIGYNYLFTFLARQTGGCPGFAAPRTQPAGLAFAVLQDSVAGIICNPFILDRITPTGRPSLEEVAASAFDALLSRAPTTDELELIRAESGCTSLTGDGECETTALATRLCTGLAGSAEMLFR